MCWRAMSSKSPLSRFTLLEFFFAVFFFFFVDILEELSSQCLFG